MILGGGAHTGAHLQYVDDLARRSNILPFGDTDLFLFNP
jgi:hypothetical protein